MAATLNIERIECYGPTENSGDDTLWGVFMAEPGRPAERVLVSWARTYGTPSPDTISEGVARLAGGFDPAARVIQSFRDRSVPHPSDHATRRVVILRPESAETA